jgi:hypothetical protein
VLLFSSLALQGEAWFSLVLRESTSVLFFGWQLFTCSHSQTALTDSALLMELCLDFTRGTLVGVSLRRARSADCFRRLTFCTVCCQYLGIREAWKKVGQHPMLDLDLFFWLIYETVVMTTVILPGRLPYAGGSSRIIWVFSADGPF